MPLGGRAYGLLDLGQVEGLFHIVYCAQFNSGFQVLLVGIAAHEDKYSVRRMFPHFVKHVDPAHPGHAHITQNDLRMMQLSHFKSFDAVGCFIYFVYPEILPGDGRDQSVACKHFIIYDQKFHHVPPTVGINAAAKVLQDQGSDVKITGLGMPSEMEAYVGEDNVCPYFYLWNPIDLGELAAHTAMALVAGDITGAAGDTFEAGDMENSPYTVVEASDGGTEIILGQPFEFNPDNIAEWADVF